LGLLLCSGADIALRRRLVQSGEGGATVDPALSARAWGLFRDLLRYLDAQSCRHDFVLRYFGDEQETLGGCGHCDVCQVLDGATPEDESVASDDKTLLVKKALSAVARAQKRAGLGAIAEMLRGVDSERTRRFGFTRLSTFALLSDRSPEWIVALLRALLAAGWIDLTTSEHPVPFLTRAGAEVMKGQAPARIVVPAEPRASRTRSRTSSGPSPSREAREVPDLDANARVLFERLRAHRAEVAKARKIPAYVIAFDRTLVEMAIARPRTEGELLAIHGMGPGRVEQYGEGFMRVILAS
jgi:ATP-dependent DNA helicase RecQ